jgi:thiosulfate/3-mercaptopyruvate sulfurtransferase
MGIDNVTTYEPSWKQWGKPANFFPVETTVNTMAGTGLPGTSSAGTTTASATENQPARQTESSSGSAPKSGYVSCGG